MPCNRLLLSRTRDMRQLPNVVKNFLTCESSQELFDFLEQYCCPIELQSSYGTIMVCKMVMRGQLCMVMCWLQFRCFREESRPLQRVTYPARQSATWICVLCVLTISGMPKPPSGLRECLTHPRYTWLPSIPHYRVSSTRQITCLSMLSSLFRNIESGCVHQLSQLFPVCGYTVTIATAWLHCLERNL